MSDPAVAAVVAAAGVPAVVPAGAPEHQAESDPQQLEGGEEARASAAEVPTLPSQLRDSRALETLQEGQAEMVRLMREGQAETARLAREGQAEKTLLLRELLTAIRETRTGMEPHAPAAESAQAADEASVRKRPQRRGRLPYRGLRLRPRSAKRPDARRLGSARRPQRARRRRSSLSKSGLRKRRTRRSTRNSLRNL